MYGKQKQLARTINQVMWTNKNLPHTFHEVSELVHHFDGNMEEIEKFINVYAKHLNC